MKLAVVALARACSRGGGRNARSPARAASPQAIQLAIASDSADAIKAELERAEHLVCAACIDMVMPLRRPPRLPRPRGRGLVDRAARCRADQVQVQMLTRLAQPDSVAGAQRRRRAGRVPLRRRPSRRCRRRCRTRLLGRGAGRTWRAALGRDRAARGGRAADGRAVGDTTPWCRRPSLQALRRSQGFRDGSRGVAAARRRRRRRQRPRRGGDDAGDVRTTPARRRRAGDGAAERRRRRSSASRRPGRWARSTRPARVAGPALQTAAANDASPLVRSLAAGASTRLRPLAQPEHQSDSRSARIDSARFSSRRRSDWPTRCELILSEAPQCVPSSEVAPSEAASELSAR